MSNTLGYCVAMTRTPPDKIPLLRAAFGKRLRHLRTQAGLDQVAAAAASGMDRSSYADVEAARYSVSIDKIFAIARGLGISTADLFADLEKDQIN